MSVIVQTPWRHRRKVLTAEPYNERKRDSIHTWIQSVLSGIQRFDMVVLGYHSLQRGDGVRTNIFLRIPIHIRQSSHHLPPTKRHVCVIFQGVLTPSPPSGSVHEFMRFWYRYHMRPVMAYLSL